MKTILGPWVLSGALLFPSTAAHPFRWDTLLSKRADVLYADGDEFRWVQRFTAIGDRFSAGIGVRIQRHKYCHKAVLTL